MDADPIMAETLGIHCGIQTDKNFHWPDVIILSDAEVVVNCINSRAHVAAIDRIIQDCRENRDVIRFSLFICWGL